jgi:hypothetical protein
VIGKNSRQKEDNKKEDACADTLFKDIFLLHKITIAVGIPAFH